MESTELSNALARHQARKLDSSRRGSGLNAVWQIALNGQPAILKTYASRRGPAETALAVVSHALTGRTQYTARARCATERESLELWAARGLDAPRILPGPPGFPASVPHLCMEFVAGSNLAQFLADDTTPLPEREAAFAGFLKHWAARHALAEQTSDVRLIQEHATLEHVIVSGSRLVTFDLEVSYTRRNSVRYCIAAEICGYIRSLFKKLPPGLAAGFLAQLVREYPDRSRLERVGRQLFASPNPWMRLACALDRRLLRKPGTMHKYEAAERLGEFLR